jgi:acyl-CoA thioester hydrolase
MNQSAHPPASLQHQVRYRVYWEDTDAGGVVYYGNYLRFLERARSDWLRSLGFAQHALQTQRGLVMVVAQFEARYLRPARLDDELVVRTWLPELGPRKMRLAQEVWCQDHLLLRASVVLIPVASATLRSTRLPEDLLAALSPYCPGAGSDSRSRSANAFPSSPISLPTKEVGV